MISLSTCVFRQLFYLCGIDVFYTFLLHVLVLFRKHTMKVFHLFELMSIYSAHSAHRICVSTVLYALRVLRHAPDFLGVCVSHFYLRAACSLDRVKIYRPYSVSVFQVINGLGFCTLAYCRNAGPVNRYQYNHCEIKMKADVIGNFYFSTFADNIRLYPCHFPPSNNLLIGQSCILKLSFVKVAFQILVGKLS